ncbi:hypothetical protein [Aeromicrobium sp.]|uniref:hypothetical protein n=1 Tax=Aeromicrobium sp. TaxID=1871063 RepID=UPI003D6B51FD
MSCFESDFFDFDDDLSSSRSDERSVDSVGSGLGGGAVTLAASTEGVGVTDGSSLVSTVGAAESLLGTFGTMAAMGEESAASELVKVTTVARATMDITVAAVNLYSLLAGTVGSPGRGG